MGEAASRRIRVFVGTGGVGKTSVAAASALGSALRGKRALVLTIDPAWRLRSALGLEPGRLEQRVPLGPGLGGELHAALMDVRATLDRAVRLYGEARQAETVLGHPVYRMLVDSLSGMQELLAVERIDQALSDGFDDICIDTAPSRHAFEFLDKPEFFAQLVAFPVVRIVGRTYKWWEKSVLSRFGRKSAELYAKVEEVLGAGLVRQVLDFYSVFRTIAEGYADRAVRTTRLLHDHRIAGFTVVSTPFKARRDADYFLAELERRKFAVERVVVNRLWPELPVAAAPAGPEGLHRALDWYRATATAQRTAWEDVRVRLQGRAAKAAAVEEMNCGVDGIGALTDLAGRLDKAFQSV